MVVLRLIHAPFHPSIQPFVHGWTAIHPVEGTKLRKQTVEERQTILDSTAWLDCGCQLLEIVQKYGLAVQVEASVGMYI